MSAHTEPLEELRFSYLPGSTDLAGLVALVRRTGLGFEPDLARISVLGDDDVEVGFDPAPWDRILDTTNATGFELTTSAALGPSVLVTTLRTAFQVVAAGAPAPEALLQGLLDSPGLVTGMRGDATDARWQGEENPNHYRMWWDGDWEHLPQRTDDRGRARIDVSRHPGRATRVAGHWLWAAQDLWFGPAAGLLVGLDALSSLPVGRTDQLGAGRWHVRLWEDGASLEQVRAAQQALRDALGFDAALAREDEIWEQITAGQPDDPMFVAQEGSYAAGGTKRFLQYFSASKHPTTRSRAATLVVQVFDDEHREVAYDEVDLTTGAHPDLG